jgi:predicted permease
VLPLLLPPDFPRLSDIAFDWRVAAAAIGLSAAAGIVVGLVPALGARRVNLVASLAEDGLAPVGGTARTGTVRARLAIMAAQVAAASVLLLGAALLTRSLAALAKVDRGYDPVNVLTAVLPLPDGSFTPQRRTDILERTVQRLEALPGVTAAAYSTRLPLPPGETMAAFPVPSRRSATGTVTGHALVRWVSRDYLGALGLRIAEGRGFGEADRPDSPGVVMVNREFARQNLDAPAVGLRLPRADNRQDEIVGVLDDVRYGGVNERAQPELYACACQAGIGSFDRVAIVVRSSRTPSWLVPVLRSILRQEAPAAALESVMTMEDRLWASLAKPRLYALLLGGFAVFAATIAGIGLFGVLSFSVLQRRREIAVRSSLGATRASIVRLVLRQAFGVAVAGLAAGLLVFAVLARFLSSLLFGITPFDAVSVAAVLFLLLLVTVAACAIPARRAARVDPAAVLR